MKANALSELNPDGYRYRSATASHTHAYLWPTLKKVLEEIPPPADLFEIGCGNGSNAHEMSKLGYRVVGIDPSKEGIAVAKIHYSDCRLELGTAYDDLAARYAERSMRSSVWKSSNTFFIRESMRHRSRRFSSPAASQW